MRADRGRTKKLIVAFHFQQLDQARWKCETCRTMGLEKKRRCGFLSAGEEPARVVWIRKRVSTTRCPRSEITAQSQAWLEEYFAWKLLGGANWEGMSARQVDAFCTLENELRMEARDGED